MQNPGGVRFTPQQVRVLVLVWTGISVLVGICTFVGVFWALGRTAPDFEATRTAEVEAQAAGRTPGQPTPEVETGETGQPRPTLPPAQDPSFGYGIQTQADVGDIDQTFTMVDQLGLTWVKQQIKWRYVQPEPGEPQWGLLDQIMQEAADHDLKVMLSIVDAPPWTRPDMPEDSVGPPDDFKHYVDFVSAVVERYPGQLHAIEVWNEQNLDREWATADGISAESYVEMLSQTYAAVKARDPGIIVISGALSPTGLDDGVQAIDDFRYFKMMIDAGMLDVADCVGAHHNGINLPPDVTAEDAFAAGAPPGVIFMGPYDKTNPLNPHHSWSFKSTLMGYHDMIVAADSDKRLCVTEFGWATMDGLPAGEPRSGFEFAWDQTLEDQATYVVQAFQLMREGDFVWLAFLWNLDFSPKAGGDPSNDNVAYSILTPKGTPRPAFDAIRDMAKN
jgi:hypothetical protein